MVNAGVVNGQSSCLTCVAFYGFFPALGRFLRLQNPVKYAGRLRVNHKWSAKLGAAAGQARKSCGFFNRIPPLKPSLRRPAYNEPLKKSGAFELFQRQIWRKRG